MTKAQDSKAAEKKPMLRRDKATPHEDMTHVLAVGLPIALVLFIVLPLLCG